MEREFETLGFGMVLESSEKAMYMNFGGFIDGLIFRGELQVSCVSPVGRPFLFINRVHFAVDGWYGNAAFRKYFLVTFDTILYLSI